MLKIDFGQSLNDHKSLLLLVKPVGYIGDKSFSQIYQEICQYRRAQVPNTTRSLHLKYAQQILPQFIEWSTFHSHRRVLGLICVAKCTDLKELEKLSGKINDLKSQFNSTLLDSRCFVIGCKSDDQTSVKKDFVVLNEENISKDIETNMAEFVASLFNVLESKRISKLSEKPDKMVLLYAPVEIDSTVTGEDNRNSKRKSIGRSRKYLGDINMLTGLHQEALNQYSMAIEHLRMVNDFLWLAGSLEGQCASSIAILNGTSSETTSKFLILPTDCAVQTVNVASSNGFGNDIDEAKYKSTLPLTIEEIYERMAEALFLYARIKDASVVEVEAHLKLTRLLVSQKKTIEASAALQNALSVNVPAITDQEKIQRYSSAAKLYSKLGFHRKSAFFTRVAAMQCVSQSLPSQHWAASYSLLLEAIKGYNIDLDGQKYVKGHINGWPVLQIRLLHELVYTARRLGDPALAVRHMMFLLHSMHDHLSDSELTDLAGGLEALAKQCSGSLAISPSSPSAHLSAQLFPEIAMTKMPLVRRVKVHQLPDHLKPVGRKTASSSSMQSHGPFIFSSLKRHPKEKMKKKNVLWVQGEVGQVSMEVYNTMPFELKVKKMALCIKGVEFESFPTCLSLPPKTGPHSVLLLGVPHTKGCLNVTGYTISTLGIESTCPLTKDNMENTEDYPVSIDITEYMPLLQVSTSLPKVRSTPADIDSPQSAPLVTAVTLYAGQSMKGVLNLQNVGKKAIELITINLGSDLGEGAHDIFSFDKTEIDSCLPLEPGKSADISVEITGIYHIPSTTSSSDNLNFDPEASWGLNGIIQFRYSGYHGEDHLYRRVEMTIDVSVVPSLHCHNYEVRAIPGDKSQFLLLFDADNKTSNDMELECSVQPHQDAAEKSSLDMLSIQGNDSKRISVYLPRFLLPITSANDEATERERRDKYCETVKDMVKLTWKLPACQVSGYGNIDTFRLDRDNLKIVKPDHISFDVVVNNDECNKEMAVTMTCCSVVDINVTVKNLGDIAYQDMSLQFEPYQDHANGYRASELNGKVAWFGDLTSCLNDVLPGTWLSHSCCFMFLYPGDYMIDMVCSGTDKLPVPDNITWTYKPSLKITVTQD